MHFIDINVLRYKMFQKRDEFADARESFETANVSTFSYRLQLQ